MGTDGSVTKGLTRLKTFVNRAAGVAMKWPFPQAAGNAWKYPQKAILKKACVQDNPPGSLAVEHMLNST